MSTTRNLSASGRRGPRIETTVALNRTAARRRLSSEAVAVIAAAVLAIVANLVAARDLGAQDALIPAGSVWQFFRGTREPSPASDGSPTTEWTLPEFDAIGWETGRLGIGFGDGDDVTVLADMEGGYSSVYLRREFRIGLPAGVRSISMLADYDDGFIVYLNGELLATANVIRAPAPHDGLAAGEHEAGRFERFDISGGIPLLVAGQNTIAIHVLNVAVDSRDLSFDVEVTADDPGPVCPPGCVIDCPVDLECTVLPRSIELSWTNTDEYDSISIWRDEVEVPGSPFEGSLSSFTDSDPGLFEHEYTVLAIKDGALCVALECATARPEPDAALISVGDSWSFFRGTTAPSVPPTDWRTPAYSDVDWEGGPTGIGYSDADDATVLADMPMREDDPATPQDESQPGYMSFFCRKTFTSPPLDEVDLLILEIDYDDGFVAYLNGVEAARSPSMGAAGVEFAFDEPSISGHEAGTPERFSLLPSLLVPGLNLLAVEVHNQHIGSSDASFAPRLTFVAFDDQQSSRMFRRGDHNGDGALNVADASGILNFLFLGGEDTTCKESQDVNGDGAVSLPDATSLLNYLFLAGPAPAPPGLGCGRHDPDRDHFSCDSYDRCP